MIEIKEEFRIPGTNILLEAGDKIKLSEAGYKGTYKDTKIEISNVDNAYGRLIAGDIAKFIKDKIEGGTGYLKVFSIKIDVV